MDAGYYSSEINIIRDACSLNDICGWYRQGRFCGKVVIQLRRCASVKKSPINQRIAPI